MMIRHCSTFARTAALFVLAALLSGCLYEHPVTPLPSTNLDTRLLGVFQHDETVKTKVDGVEVQSIRVHRVAIVRQDVNRYTILYKNVTDAPKKVLRFTGWISRVDTDYYLTFRDDDKDSKTFGKFGFVRYKWTWPSDMVISAPSVDPEAVTSSFAFRELIRKSRKEGTLFPFEPTFWNRIARVWWDIKSDDPTANIPEAF